MNLVSIVQLLLLTVEGDISSRMKGV